MNLGEHNGWVFCENYAPVELFNGYLPDVPDSAIAPWVRMASGNWYEYYSWQRGQPGSYMNKPPKAYLVQYFLIK